MAEMLDFYDKEMNFLGTETRENVHANGLWHKTVHCWLYDENGNIYFQIRTDTGTLYTTASGHMQASETIDDALRREIMEEVGYPIDTTKKELLAVDVWTMCSEKCGIKKQDNVFANVYMCRVDSKNLKFHFDETEVSGAVRVNAADTLNLFLGKCDTINGTLFDNNGSREIVIAPDKFLLCNGEIAILKYGRQLKFVVNKHGE
ncbi:MAG: NUDIX domain-containing protein [Alphaproteobacteria bacterium]|nr:NUDIX domain-containing protein [Alphaproteobacteria bacterium]